VSKGACRALAFLIVSSVASSIAVARAHSMYQGLSPQGANATNTGQSCSFDSILLSGFDLDLGSAVDLSRFGEGGWQIPMDAGRAEEGTIVIVGNFDGSLDFGTGDGPLTNSQPDDVFVVKLDPCGVPIWRKSFGDSETQTVQRVAIDHNGNILLIGEFRGAIDFGGGPLLSVGGDDIFVAKLDGAGNYLWSYRFGDAEDQFGRGIASDAMGNVYITGSFWGVVDFGGGQLHSAGWEDIFLAKFTAAGQFEWAKQFGDAETQEAWDLATDQQGNVLLTGYALGNLNFGDGLTTGAGMPDAILAKFDGNGSALWSHRFGDAGLQFGQSVAVDSNANVFMVGEVDGSIDFGDGPYTSAGGYDLFAVKFSADGALEWHREFGDAANQSSIVAAVANNGDLLLTGMAEGQTYFDDITISSAGSSDAFVARITREGAVCWARGMGDASFQAGTAIAVDGQNNVLVAGKMVGSIEIDGLSASTVQDTDLSLFLVRLSP
jgi:hypothetical protein